MANKPLSLSELLSEHDEIAALRAEIERLQSDYAAAYKNYVIQRDENERLRAHIAILTEEGHAEVERLRADYGRLNRYATDEMERLRAALMGLVEALHDATPDGPTLVGQAEAAAIEVLARDKAS